MNLRKIRGFTLIELLIAIIILAIISALAYGGLNSILKNHAILTQKTESLTQLTQTLTQLQNDLRHIVPRPIHDKFNTLLPALRLETINGLLLSFTRGGIPNPTAVKRNSLQRIDYIFLNNTLKKRIWLTVDYNNEADYYEEIVLSALSQFKVEVLGFDGIWYRQWPGDRSMPADLLPQAIKITFTFSEFGEISRLIELPL
jgi:general secretion pathway protein J